MTFHLPWRASAQRGARDIGRSSKWANPFRKGTRRELVEQYRAWVVQQPDLMAALPELKGKALGCWCKPKPCHGDVLAELAERMA